MIFEVAGGIILAVLFFMFLPQILRVGAVLLVVAAVIIGIVLIVVLVQPETKPAQPPSAPQAATVKPWEKYSQSAPLEQSKNPTLADLQALRKKSLEKPTANTLPTPSQIIPQAMNTCVLAAANNYQIPPAVLIGIMDVEDSHAGAEATSNLDKGQRLDRMNINHQFIPQLAQTWHVNNETAQGWLKNDDCISVHAAGWILAQKIAEGGNLYQAIGQYHSDNSAAATDYAKKVIEAMDKKGLVNHDAPLPQ